MRLLIYSELKFWHNFIEIPSHPTRVLYDPKEPTGVKTVFDRKELRKIKIIFRKAVLIVDYAPI